jgi:predicted transcriptional regulator
MSLHWYNTDMTPKEIALKTIQPLPDNASWEDVQERINFVAGLRKGLSELDAGQGIAHEEIKAELGEWLAG